VAPITAAPFAAMGLIEYGKSDFEVDKRLHGIDVEWPNQLPVNIWTVQYRYAMPVFTEEVEISLDINVVPGGTALFDHLLRQFTQMAVRTCVQNDFPGPIHVSDSLVFERSLHSPALYKPRPRDRKNSILVAASRH